MMRTNGNSTHTSGKKSIWKKVKIISLSLLAVVALVIGSGFVYEAFATKQGAKAYPPPGKLVDTGEYDLHLVKKGIGGPTIVLEAGSGETSLSWRNIPDELAAYATVVAYDRAGYAWSEKAKSERNGENIVQELYAALKKEGIEAPYLMVGHSLGGMYARLFAETYRDEVMGLVLVDARPENDERDSKIILEKEGFTGNLSSSMMKLLKQSGFLRIFQDVLLDGLVAKEDRGAFINVISTPEFFEAKEEEGRLAYMTEDAIRGQRLGELPVRIISRGLAQDYAAAGISEEGGRKLEAIWQEGQRDMLEISTDSQLTVAETSGHMVIHDQPELVVDTILDMLQ
ncbi:alpha/beta fold hydrolase [Niallia circulans]|uniref:alpha/beta fold hydrolase n=1 Tax=Niallia circulans TaxID=1397 RepID=UPI001F2AE2EE|nr:alpha/beta hydrolase [Niallia circulans]